LLAEEFYITVNPFSFEETKHYDDILIIKFNKEGEIVWGRSMHKADLMPSYNAFVKDDELHVLLNSGVRFWERNDGRILAQKGLLEYSALYDFVFDENGERSIRKIQDNKGNAYYLPYFGDFQKGKFIMINDKSRKRQFMTLE
jgi:uncharacterized protein YuzE